MLKTSNVWVLYLVVGFSGEAQSQAQQKEIHDLLNAIISFLDDNIFIPTSQL